MFSLSFSVLGKGLSFRGPVIYTNNRPKEPRTVRSDGNTVRRQSVVREISVLVVASGEILHLWRVACSPCAANGHVGKPARMERSSF